MAGATVRYDGHDGALLIGGRSSGAVARNDGGGEFFAHIDDVRPASATQLLRALQAATDDYGTGQALAVSEVDRSLFDDEYSPSSPISFTTDDDGLVVEVGFFVDDLDEHLGDAVIRPTLTPMLTRLGWQYLGVDLDPYHAASPWLWDLRVRPKTHGKTMGELFDHAQAVADLLGAASGGGLRRETALELLRAGRAELLIGQPEGDWLDVKRQDYDLSSDAGKISIAQDAARFANAEYGGIVVIGMAAKKTPDGEVITDVRPLPPDIAGVRRHRQALDHRLFPPLEGLTVEEVAVRGGRLVLINVPPQPDELKPFLVHGALVGGKVEGAFISIVRRRGEASIPISAPAIHTFLAAGRALLQRGVLPDDEL